MNYKSLIAKEDLALATGGTKAAETLDRRTSTGAVVELNKIDATHIKYRFSEKSVESSANSDFLVAEYGTDLSLTTINACIADLGTSKGKMRFTPGNWLVTDDVTIPNAAVVEEGAYFVVTAGKVLTFSDDVIAGKYKIYSTSVVYSKRQKVYAVHFGVVADGVTENLTYLTNAISTAKGCYSKLVFPSGTVKVTPTATLNITGIPSFVCEDGNCLIDCSSCIITSPLFYVEGTKTLIASAQTLSMNDTDIVVTAGTYNEGDTILIVSNDVLPNTRRDYYYKGGRHYVESYDAATSTLVIAPNIDYDYTNAYVYHISYEPEFNLGPEISIHGNFDVATHKGLSLRFASCDINAKFRYFRFAACSFIDSVGRFNGEIRNCWKENADMGYGVAVQDLSEVIINGNILGCRHCVTGGGGTVWKTSDVGVVGGTDAICPPASYDVTGGFYKSVDRTGSGYAVEAHGNCKYVNVTGATIFNGLSLSSQYGHATGNMIMFRGKYGVYVASDNNSLSWGDYLIQSNKIKLIGSGVMGESRHVLVMDSSNKCRKLRFNDNVCDKSGATNTDDTTFYQLAGQISDLEMLDNKFDASITSPTTDSLDCVINQYGYLKYRNNKHLYNRLLIYPKADNLNLDLDDNVFMVSPNWGCIITGTDGYYDNINYNRNHSRRCWYGGIYVLAKVVTFEAKDNIGRNLNQYATSVSAAVSGAYANVRIDPHADCENIILINNTAVDDQASTTCPYNIYVAAGVAVTANVVWNNNVALGCYMGNYLNGTNLVKIDQRGNRGDGIGTVYPDMLIDAAGVKWRVKTDGTLEAFS